MFLVVVDVSQSVELIESHVTHWLEYIAKNAITQDAQQDELFVVQLVGT